MSDLSDQLRRLAITSASASRRDAYNAAADRLDALEQTIRDLTITIDAANKRELVLEAEIGQLKSAGKDVAEDLVLTAKELEGTQAEVARLTQADEKLIVEQQRAEDAIGKMRAAEAEVARLLRLGRAGLAAQLAAALAATLKVIDELAWELIQSTPTWLHSYDQMRVCDQAHAALAAAQAAGIEGTK